MNVEAEGGGGRTVLRAMALLSLKEEAKLVALRGLLIVLYSLNWSKSRGTGYRTNCVYVIVQPLTSSDFQPSKSYGFY